MSGPVVPFAEQSNFPQQGSLDWVALSKASFTCSVDVMSRMSKAGVEMITIAMGRFICSGFNLKADAQKRLFDALANLKSFASYGRVIWFGFGVKHVLKDLCETEQGAACVALCACLAVSYDSFFAAEVLKELCKVRGTPSDLTPSIHQWNSLVSVCAGAISTSQFPILIEGFARLTPRNTDLAQHESTTPEALAKVLGALADVSNGKLTNITISGGLDCSWLAAVSQWLLSLHIEIHLHSGDCIYQSPGSQTSCLPQVTIVFDLGGQVKSQLSLVNKFYMIPSGRRFWGVKSREQFFVAGRLEWRTVLRNSFGSSIDTLTRGTTGQHFAMLLLYASKEANRQYRGRFVSNVIPHLPEPFHFGYEACKGRAFLSFAARRLPELSSLIEGIIDKGSEPYTRSNWIECIGQIESACTSPGWPGLGYGDGFAELCLRTVAETIVVFIWILSALKVDDSLLPSSNGLLALYYYQHHYRSGDICPPCSGILSMPILSLALTIFSGSSPDSPSGDHLAIAKNGVCVYFRALEDLDLPPSEVSTVLVVPGYIEYEGVVYKTLYDLSPTHTTSRISGHLGVGLSCALIAKETPRENSLAAAYRMSNTTGDCEWWLGITTLRSAIAKAIRGSNTCLGQLCYEWKPQQLTRDCETREYILEVYGPGAKPASVGVGKRWTLVSWDEGYGGLMALKREYYDLYLQLVGMGVRVHHLIELGDCPGCAIRSICQPKSRPNGNIRASARAFSVNICGTMKFVTSEGGQLSIETLSYSLRTSSELALYEASREGDLGRVRLLLQEGVDVNLRGGAEGTALQVASAGGHQPVVQLLVENGAYAFPSQALP